LADPDLIVVGAGAAGLYATLTAARAGARPVLVSATPLAESASYWAQGGLAAATAPDDSPQRHLDDTVKAGRGAVRPSASRAATPPAASPTPAAAPPAAG
jgi:L-aspartate oxidase